MQNKRNCFMDFDGTIICNKNRLYKFFVKNIKEEYKEALTEDEFWALKKLGINEIDWINRHYKDNLCAKEWNNKKKELIETDEYLRYNNIFDFSIDALKALSEKYKLILITRRSNEENVIKEIKGLEIYNIFHKVLVVPHHGGTKADFIRNQGIDITTEDIFVGDTEDDVEAALDLGMTPFMVKSGIRSEWIIKKLFKDRDIKIINNISELI